ncbi:hypothetical protein Ahp2_52 [Aeromonas phage Ahp2]|nr:hypothetical protein Ahp2_52 [Aeromonas phage Ahp2]
MVEYRVSREGRHFHFVALAGYCALMVWNGPEVLCEGGHLKVGSALKHRPETMKAVCDKWLDQYYARVNSNVKGRGKKRK